MAYSRRGSVVSIALVGGLAVTYKEYVEPVLWLLLILVTIRVAMKLYIAFRSLVRRFRYRNIDTMDGLVFEHYVAALLKTQGFQNVSLTEKYDYGVDIIAEKDGIRWGVQVKRYSGLVKAAAVRQVVTGLNIYGCDQAMVVTNSTFSTVAQKLARSNNCVLVDRNKLDKLSR